MTPPHPPLAAANRRTRARRRGRPGHLPVALAIALSLTLATGSVPPARAGDEPFTGPSNYGLTGLMEIPTARVMTEDRYRVGVTQVHPYRYFYGTVGLFERLEVNGRVTQVIGVPGFDNSSGYGDYKDKAFDAKLQLVKEGKYFPAVSVVVSEPTGTRVYASQSIVASKQIYPFDVTIGLGNGRLGKRQLPEKGEGFQSELFTNPRSWWRDALPFGGIQFAPTDWLALMAEYSPVRYQVQTRDPAQPKYFQDPVPSKLNAGIRLKPLRWAELDASWQRGEEFGISASFSFDIGRPILPIYDPPYREPEPLRTHPLADRIAAALKATGFSDIAVDQDDRYLLIDAENDRYFFTPNAVMALMETVAPMVPPRCDYLRIRIKENGIPVTEFTANATALEKLRQGNITRSQFFDRSWFRTERIGSPIPGTKYRRWYDWEILPSFEAFLNDPAKFFTYRLGVSATVSTFPWKGGMAVAGAAAYPVNTVTTANEPLSIPVRSDVALYKEQSVSLNRLLLQQIGKAEASVYGRIAAGLLETEYAGVDVEVAAPLFRDVELRPQQRRPVPGVVGKFKGAVRGTFPGDAAAGVRDHPAPEEGGGDLDVHAGVFGLEQPGGDATVDRPL
ncbi:MAG: YjbH domain-containing protein, partial [Verrucomicrobiota bacterium]